jgi:hypothetical protein
MAKIEREIKIKQPIEPKGVGLYGDNKSIEL